MQQKALFEIQTKATGISIEEQTGWKRSRPQTILQDIDLLLKVTEYDYDVTNRDFLEYAYHRGCLNGPIKRTRDVPKHFQANFILSFANYSRTHHKEKTIVECLEDPYSMCRTFIFDHTLTFEDYWASSCHRVSFGGAFLSDEERRTTWKVILIARAHLQDCWEIFNDILDRREDVKGYLAKCRETWDSLNLTRPKRFPVPEFFPSGFKAKSTTEDERIFL